MASQPSRPQRFLGDRVADLGVVLTGFFAIVVLVAGGSAVALLIWPNDSGAYFSWDLGAPEAAALIGGLYLASVIVFAEAAIRPRQETRALTFGVLALALPTLVFTAANHRVFDWGRPQAVAWVILFCSAPISIALDLRTPTPLDPSPPASVRTRAALAGISVASLLLAGALWTETTRSMLADAGLVPLAGLTADYLGAWCAFVAAVAGIACRRGRTSDARTTGVLLAAIALGATVAAVRTSTGLDSELIGSIVGIAAMGLAGTRLIHQHLSPQPHPTHQYDKDPAR